MLRGRRELRSNLTDASDLKNIYLACLKRGERLPVSFAIGSHPIDYLAATCKMPIDEFGLVATLRGEPVPMVRGLTNGVLAPADAEIIIEGYFDELGYREHEGPYGEFYGFYGPIHIDPVFHATAITMRRDALHQTVLHSGRFLSRTDSGNLASLHTEVAIWRALRAVRIEPSAVYVVPASNGRPHARIALRQTAPGQARAAINALFALVQVKHVFVVDDDVDVFSSEEMEWAMASRFRADRDLVVASGLPGFYADPNADAANTVAKLGFDLTKPVSQAETIDCMRAFARPIGRSAGAAPDRPAGAGKRADVLRADHGCRRQPGWPRGRAGARRAARGGNPLAARARRVGRDNNAQGLDSCATGSKPSHERLDRKSPAPQGGLAPRHRPRRLQ